MTGEKKRMYASNEKPGKPLLFNGFRVSGGEAGI